MEFKIVNKSEVYDTMLDWWGKRGFPVIPFEGLPDNIAVVVYQGVLVYAVPIYRTDSTVCWLGFPTSNPDKGLTKETRDEAFQFLMLYLESDLREAGYNEIVTTSGTERMMELFEKCSFTMKEQVNFYSKNLWEQH